MNKKNVLVMVLAIVLTAALSVGGTLAWLIDTTGEVKNTFTTAGIDIDLTETPNQDDNTWKAQLVPGIEYAKNPVVSVVRDETDVDIYLFVEFVETVDEAVLTYTSTLTASAGWTKLTGEDNVWYRTVAAAETTTCGVDDCSVTNPHWHLLAGDKVSIANTVTEDMIPSNDTTMTWTAYAIQVSGFEDNVTGAWEAISTEAAN